VTYHGLRKLYRVRVMSCLHLFCHCVNKVVPKETLILKLAAMKHFLSICVHGGTQTSRSQNYGHTHTHTHVVCCSYYIKFTLLLLLLSSSSSSSSSLFRTIKIKEELTGGIYSTRGSCKKLIQNFRCEA
jgi:hypothetical protein